MKKTIGLLSLLFSTVAFSAEKEEIFNAVANVHLFSLRCVVDAAIQTELPLEQRLQTELTSPWGLQLIPFGAIELKHRLAQQKSCDLARLDKIVQDSFKYFKSAQNVAIQLKKHTEASYRNGNGHCVTHYTETLVMDFGGGVVLTSEEGQLRQANDCP